MGDSASATLGTQLSCRDAGVSANPHGSRRLGVPLAEDEEVTRVGP
jgi:hypothetical protein